MNGIRLEYLILIRNRSVLLLCSAYLIAGMAALFFGTQRYYSERSQLAELEERYKTDIAEWQQKIESKGVGYAAYYLFNPVALHPSPWSALFSGERKENAVLQRIRLLAVHGQIHGSPINNSEHSSLGLLDVQFVWLYLLPLLIGLISVTNIADDRRLGRWPLINALSPVYSLLAKRMLVRFSLVVAINLLLLASACLLLPIPVEYNLMWVLAALIAYHAFWFLVSSAIILTFLNARQSLLTYVAAWMICTWLLPAIHYSESLHADTYNSGVELLVKQRQDMNDSWDRDKQSDFEEFLLRHPQWKQTTALGESFDWKWYFAMQKRSDDTVNEIVAEYLESKTRISTLWQWLSPTLVTQNLFEDIANTSAKDYQNWLKSVVAWHTKTQNFWFPYFFFEKTFQKEDLNTIPRFAYKPSNTHTSSFTVYWVALLLLCFTFLYLLVRAPPQTGIKGTSF